MKAIIVAAALAALPLAVQAAETPAPAAAPAAPAAPAPVAAPAAPAAPAGAEKAKILTIDSTVGELIDNPKTDAVLKKIIPDVRSNGMFDTMGRDLALSEITQYETDITPDKLAAIKVELAKVQSPDAAQPAAAPAAPAAAPARPAVPVANPAPAAPPPGRQP